MNMTPKQGVCMDNVGIYQIKQKKSEKLTENIYNMLA